MINFKINARRVKNITVIIVIIIITVILKAPAEVRAQTISLSIWPPLLEAVIQPGKAITQVFRLKNLGDDTIIHASVVPFEPSGDFGRIAISQTASPALAYFSLQNADLDLPAIIPLKSGQTQEFVLKIKVPETAAEADHYFAFLFSADTKGLISASGTTTLGSIAANILLTVSQTGELHPTAKIEEFRPSRSNLVGPRGYEPSDRPSRSNLVGSFLDSFSPINFILKLKNTSSTRLKAVGQIEVKNTFNRLVATLPLREDNVLAHSSRYLQGSELSGSSEPCISWNPIFPLGRYTAIATITPQNTTSQISQTIHFYVLPYKALLAIISLLIIYLLTKQKLSIHNRSK